jgi:prolyl oligopeptidase
MRLIAPLFALAGLALAACANLPASGDAVSADNDPFAWMEEVEGERALTWVREQNAQTLPRLEGDPRFPGLLADALAIVNNRERLPLGGIREGYLYNFWQDETNVRGLLRRSPLGAYAAGAPAWETVLDIDALAAAENANWVYKGWACQSGGTRCMVSLSNGGLDATTWREFDTATRSFVADGFVVPEAKSSVEWLNNDTLLVGTDWGPGSLTESGYAMDIRAWNRGAQLSSAQSIVRGQATDVGVFVAALEGEDGTRVGIAIEADTFFTNTVWRLDGETPRRLTLPPMSSVLGLHKGQVLFTLQQAWTPPGATEELPQGALAAMPLDEAHTAQPRVTLIYQPGPRDSIEGVGVTSDAVLAAIYSNVRGRMLRFAFDGRGWVETEIALPQNGAVNIVSTDVYESTAFAVYEDFLNPSTLYRVDSREGTAAAVRALPAMFDASPYVTEQFEAVSADGTRVPYFVVHRRDIPLDGSTPTLLYGYGGFQVSMTPGYSASVGRMWLEEGGAYVLANIRGGGEFGPAWHQAGLRTNRQVIYDDFIAVAEDLIARRITSSRRLGIMGGSNGGLLMGVMLTQRPELFRAAVVQVPLLDMVNFANENMLAGASWVDEYGDPRLNPDGTPVNAEERAFLMALSPYQNINPAALAAVEPFFVTSTKDDRVHPAHARKTAARLQAAGAPFYYYENIDGGHSAAANLQEAARRRALEYTYLAQRLMD